jgi:hypothetical protein
MMATVATAQRCNLDVLARLDAAASPGPWYVCAMDDALCCSAAAVATAPNTSGDNDDLSDSTYHGIVAATFFRTATTSCPRTVVVGKMPS